jgi:hypothetical protein
MAMRIVQLYLALMKLLSLTKPLILPWTATFLYLPFPLERAVVWLSRRQDRWTAIMMTAGDSLMLQKKALSALSRLVLRARFYLFTLQLSQLHDSPMLQTLQCSVPTPQCA